VVQSWCSASATRDALFAILAPGTTAAGGWARSQDDRARDALLLARGLRTLRFTDRALTTRPRLVADTIAAALADRRAA
jgi:hypothetical protein